MRPILVSQRVDVCRDRQERRDVLDQRLCRFLGACGCLPVPVPNAAALVPGLWEAVQPQGVLLSGGNDLLALGGDVPEREAAETLLIELAARHGKPVFGICHGLQLLAHLGGATLSAMGGHVASRHELTGAVCREVNSYHQWGIQALGADWEALARARDESVEYACCRSMLQGGIMWHPEREEPFVPEDMALVREALGG